MTSSGCPKIGMWLPGRKNWKCTCWLTGKSLVLNCETITDQPTPSSHLSLEFSLRWWHATMIVANGDTAPLSHRPSLYCWRPMWHHSLTNWPQPASTLSLLSAMIRFFSSSVTSQNCLSAVRNTTANQQLWHFSLQQAKEQERQR